LARQYASMMVAVGCVVAQALATTTGMVRAQDNAPAQVTTRAGAGLKVASARITAEEPIQPIVIRHVDSSTEGWSVADSANFRLWHQDSRARAEQVLRAAERARTRVSRKWFGAVAGPWEPRCELNLYPSAMAYQRATGLPARAPGYALTQHEGERVISRRIDLRGDWPDLLATVLPHEVTHIVLSDQLGSQPLPSWANEGIAVLNEPPANIARHLRNLARHRDEGMLFSMQGLVESTDYPDRRAMGAFYAQSISLVQLLVKERGPEAFTSFLRCTMRAGAGPALRRHYGMTFDELERRWQQHAFEAVAVAE
jgi:Peptidase MA superfamily